MEGIHPFPQERGEATGTLAQGQLRQGATLKRAFLTWQEEGAYSILLKGKWTTARGLLGRWGELAKQEVMLTLCNFSAFFLSINGPRCTVILKTNKQTNMKPYLILGQVQFCAWVF